MGRPLGLLIIGLGLAALVIGALVYVGGFSWFGRLPGDIHIERENTRIFVPITSMIVVSVVLTVVLNLISRWW